MEFNLAAICDRLQILFVKIPQNNDRFLSVHINCYATLGLPDKGRALKMLVVSCLVLPKCSLRGLVLEWFQAIILPFPNPYFFEYKSFRC